MVCSNLEELCYILNKLHYFHFFDINFILLVKLKRNLVYSRKVTFDRELLMNCIKCQLRINREINHLNLHIIMSCWLFYLIDISRKVQWAKRQKIQSVGNNPNHFPFFFFLLTLIPFRYMHINLLLKLLTNSRNNQLINWNVWITHISYLSLSEIDA